MSGQVQGHTAMRVAAGRGAQPAAHDDRGGLLQRHDGPGHAKCSCREVSGESLPTGAARRRWHGRHKEQVSGVAWA